ncbi:MAG: hypothetical protein FJ083_03065 [Cyanobacteria bacterium K_Offshore_surface_m2_239]|nr:hypothetical protein [Cyanobacteria bacterium K_Offshore_surface_m2_239]
MRDPLEDYGPQEGRVFSPGPPGPDGFRWLQWLQLALSSALLVVFVNQVMSLREVNRQIARLHERIDLLESSRMLESRPLMDEKQRTLEQRLRQLEETLRELSAESRGTPPGEVEIPAFQMPPPPRTLR